jgi:hypothetical protein
MWNKGSVLGYSHIYICVCVCVSLATQMFISVQHAYSSLKEAMSRKLFSWKSVFSFEHPFHHCYQRKRISRKKTINLTFLLHRFLFLQIL